LLVLLLVTVVSAQEIQRPEYQKTIPRYTDFPLDNIHIVRLQEAASSLENNVQKIEEGLRADQERQSAQLSELRGNIDSFQRSVLANIAALQNSIDTLSARVDGRPVPEYAVPAPTTPQFPAYLVLLLSLTVFLLVIVIILIFWLREQYYVHREIHTTEHIHPAPLELVSYVGHQLEHKKKLHDIRLELARKGWTPSIIEHAIHAAKEK